MLNHQNYPEAYQNFAAAQSVGKSVVSQYESDVAEVHRAISDLEMMLGDLRGKLSPVINDQPVPAGACKDGPSRSPLGHEMQSFAGRINAIALGVASLNKSIDL